MRYPLHAFFETTTLPSSSCRLCHLSNPGNLWMQHDSDAPCFSLTSLVRDGKSWLTLFVDVASTLYLLQGNSWQQLAHVNIRVRDKVNDFTTHPCPYTRIPEISKCKPARFVILRNLQAHEGRVVVIAGYDSNMIQGKTHGSTLRASILEIRAARMFHQNYMFKHILTCVVSITARVGMINCLSLQLLLGVRCYW